MSTSNIFKIVALFLPIKILLVLASGGTSRYMRLIPLDPDIVLMGMVVAMPLLYAGSILCASGHRHAVDAAVPSDRPFTAQPLRAKRFETLYENCLASASNTALILITIGIGFAINWILGALLAGLIAIYTIFVVLVLLPKPFRHISWGKLRSTQIMEYANVLAFFAAFMTIAGLVMAGALEVYGAILSLLMSRMMLRSVKDILSAAHRNMRDYERWNRAQPNNLAQKIAS